jgi:hypothetical protein
MKIFEGLSNSKNMVFDLKNLLNVGIDLRYVKEQKEATLVE